MNTRALATALLAGGLSLLVLAACARPPTEPDAERRAEQEAAAADARQNALLERQRADARQTQPRPQTRHEAYMPAVATLAPPPGSYSYPPHPQWGAPEVSRENYAHSDENPVRLTEETPVSTFGVDVDTGSYSNVRRWLQQGQLPPMDAVRVEEMINYFDYGYLMPESREQPFAVSTVLSTAPWNEKARLLRIGIQGYDIERAERPAANLVFLVDVSGSMQSPDKLELLKQGLGLLVNELEARDSISLVVYAGATGVVLPPTSGSDKATIRAALSQLVAGGSTNGGDGIRLAYDMARQAHIKNGINRVILATDGDFNVGTVNFEELIDIVERERDSGVTLTTLGFGTGNYNDHLMEQLADKGNGNYAYIDSMTEARKVLVEELSSTLFVIAKDVKAQIEFNPAIVAEYRLIGYENRVLAREDFNNDAVDAGDIGAGHSVTALYEIVLVGSDARRVDDLRYRTPPDVQIQRRADAELAFLKLRYKLPDENESRLIERPLRLGDELPFEKTDADFRFAAAVAAFGQKLRGGKYLGDFEYADIRALALSKRGDDALGYRGEFLQLVGLAESLDVAAGGAPGNSR